MADSVIIEMYNQIIEFLLVFHNLVQKAVLQTNNSNNIKTQNALNVERS